ncbi:MAG: phosphatase PAP2 family protein [bacterium]|nr:phosphatase PAP2 family protein [bacterium]
MVKINEELFRLVFQFAHRSVFLDWVGIFLATYLPYLLVLAALVLIFYKRDWREKFFYVIEAILSVVIGWGIVSNSLRFFYGQLRPFEVFDVEPLVNGFGYSFPSGHASILFALSMVVFYVNKRWGMWFFVLSLINGVSRIFAGVHYPLDILAGAAIGVLSGFLVYMFLKPYLNRFGFTDKESETIHPS